MKCLAEFGCVCLPCHRLPCSGAGLAGLYGHGPLVPTEAATGPTTRSAFHIAGLCYQNLDHLFHQPACLRCPHLPSQRLAATARAAATAAGATPASPLGNTPLEGSPHASAAASAAAASGRLPWPPSVQGLESCISSLHQQVRCAGHKLLTLLWCNVAPSSRRGPRCSQGTQLMALTG